MVCPLGWTVLLTGALPSSSSAGQQGHTGAAQQQLQDMTACMVSTAVQATRLLGYCCSAITQHYTAAPDSSAACLCRYTTSNRSNHTPAFAVTQCQYCLLVPAGARQLRVTAPLSAKDTLDLQDAHREALALIEAASMGVGGFMGALGATALASTTVAGVPGAPGSQRTSVAAAAASIVARQERALKWSQGVLARALETREASFR